MALLAAGPQKKARPRESSSSRWLFWCISVAAVFLSVFLGSPLHRSNEGGVSLWGVHAEGIYASNNNCISHRVDYSMELFSLGFKVNETIVVRPTESVIDCHFHAEKFKVRDMKVEKGGTREYSEMQLLPHGVYAVQMGKGRLWEKDTEYNVSIRATKPFAQVGDGLTFKVYREQATFKRNWYALVHMSPSQCGKAFFCTNNLKDLSTLRLQVIHWRSHSLHCAGKTTSKSYSLEKTISICENTFKVGVNNLHYSVSNFAKLEYLTETVDKNHLHHITMVGPKNDRSVIYHRLTEHFQFILRIYSLLLMTINLKPFHAIFYVLPNYHKEVPAVYSGSCYFKLENLLFNIDIETTHRSYLKCLLHQGFMNEGVTDSWALRYVPEGLFERFVNTYEIQGMKNDYYKSVLLGDSNDLDSLAKYDKYPEDIPIKRPWSKAAGFWDMLDSISPEYGRLTFGSFPDNAKPIETHADFVQWITNYSNLLQLNESSFLQMLYTWTAPKGYPTLVANVLNIRTVCVREMGGEFEFSSRIVPFVLDFGYPYAVPSNLMWVQPEVSSNCHRVLGDVYPYLVNGNIRMVGRVLYDRKNWEAWSVALKQKMIRDALTTSQKVTLIMDALYFAQTGKLDWTMCTKFLALICDETDELAWRSFDNLFAYLESLTRYTNVYPMFKKWVADVARKYYYAKRYPTGVGIKWFCFAGVVDCLTYAEELTRRALEDHTYMPNRTEVLCGGMRRLTLEQFRAMINSMGRPDWREPIFYVEMMICADNGRILRELMHHLFFYKSWLFRRSLLKRLLIRMIERGRAGSDAVFYYLDHNPRGMMRQLEVNNLLDVFEVLAKYTRDLTWLKRFIARMRMARGWDEKYSPQLEDIFEQLKRNKRWYNGHYERFTMFLIEGYRFQLAQFEG